MLILNYLLELLKHKYLVFKCGLRFKVPIWLLIIHDLSKFTPQEFIPYSKMDGGIIKKNSEEFEQAWLRHHGINKHHWEYWISPKLKGDKILPMPEIYLRELLADWCATGIRFNNRPSVYYENHKLQFKLHPETRMKLEYYLRSYDL